MQNQNQKNLLLFIVLTTALMLGWYVVRPLLWPAPPQQQPPPLANRQPPTQPVTPEQPPRPPQPPAQPPPQTSPLVATTLGSADRNSPYFLQVKLTSRGAGVQQVILNRFQKADPFGLPAEGPLELLQEVLNTEVPSNLLYAVDPAKPLERPFVTLGVRNWEMVGDEERDLDDGGKLHTVQFRTTYGNVVLTKIFTLKTGDYHLGLELKVERRDPNTEARFCYHLTSGHGLPIEGIWYTHIFRNSLIGRVDPQGHARRTLQDLRQIMTRGGGDEVIREDGAIQYAGVGVQYFTSLLVVDNDQPQKNFLDHARPTLENGIIRGTVASVAPQKASFVVHGSDGVDTTILVDGSSPPRVSREAGQFTTGFDLNPGDEVSVVAVPDAADQVHAREIYAGSQAHALLFPDIAVHVVSDVFDVPPEGVAHKYLLYNGPLKVRQLGQPERGEQPVSQALVDRYHDTLHLNTLTDAPSQWWGGAFFESIGWTWLLIQFTNIMHEVLYRLHYYIMPWSWGLCIILLTLLVRGLMLPLSRKQSLTALKMQALAPELKKLQEKYKDDRQALGMAQMDLYRKHGVNPLGSCWLVFLQMPIFLGLYYCLQESVHFRLAPFLPGLPWIRNLAAPDMLFWWTESIPWISSPQSYGGFTYLGPFFNLLPIVAVTIMMAQQKMMTPPPADEQQEMQQKMMRWMMILFGVMFYKLMAGVCVYYIASSLWGFAERKFFLPKKKPDGGVVSTAENSGEGVPERKGFMQRMVEQLSKRPQEEGTSLAADGNRERTSGADAPRGGKRRNRRQRERERRRGQGGGSGGGPTSADNGVLGKLKSWWADVLRNAQKR